MSKIVNCCFILLLFKWSFATTLAIPADGDVVGEVQYAYAQAGETIGEVGVRYDVGYYEMVHANPHVDPARPLSPQQRLLIPSQFILPQVPRTGLVINLAEYRLYFFPPNDNVVITQPVGIGRKGWATPIGVTKVIAKERNPVWRPTANLHANAAEHGVALPDYFPPGAANPLGKYIFRLGWPSYLIHGTNQTDVIGMRATAGCIRLLPEDIEYLYGLVKIGTQVRVINQPLKTGKINGALYIEVHPLQKNKNSVDLVSLAQQQLTTRRAKQGLNTTLLNQELRYPTGIPRKIIE